MIHGLRYKKACPRMWMVDVCKQRIYQLRVAAAFDQVAPQRKNIAAWNNQIFEHLPNSSTSG